MASAGRDLNLIGAIVTNQGGGGLTSLSAKNDINLGTVTETRSVVGIGATSPLAVTSRSELGSTIATNGTTILSAGRDMNARQATVDAGQVSCPTVHVIKSIELHPRFSFAGDGQVDPRGVNSHDFCAGAVQASDESPSFCCPVEFVRRIHVDAVI